MSDCLVLNADYRPLSYLPLSTIPWQQAVKLSFMGRITILEEYENWKVHSPSTTINVPALAITKEYMKYKKGVRFSRKNLYLRDLYQCQYCGDTFDAHQLVRVVRPSGPTVPLHVCLVTLKRVTKWYSHVACHLSLKFGTLSTTILSI